MQVIFYILKSAAITALLRLTITLQEAMISDSGLHSLFRGSEINRLDYSYCLLILALDLYAKISTRILHPSSVYKSKADKILTISQLWILD